MSEIPKQILEQTAEALLALSGGKPNLAAIHVENIEELVADLKSEAVKTAAELDSEKQFHEKIVDKILIEELEQMAEKQAESEKHVRNNTCGAEGDARASQFSHAEQVLLARANQLRAKHKKPA